MLMQMVLGRFDYETVRAAFGKYLQVGATMPTPADIVKIIEPPVEVPQFSATVFIDIKRRTREGQFITKAEKQYCEDFISSKVNNPIVDDAVKQVEQQDKQYWLA